MNQKTYISLERGLICFRDHEEHLRFSLKLEQLQERGAQIEIPEMLPPFASQPDSRIEQLERALQSCRAVLERQQETAQQFSTAAVSAIVEADKALAL